MQQQNQSSVIFSQRTDALSTALKISLRDLAPKIGISQAMLFAYRNNKYPISEKAWRKLEAAEEAVAKHDDFEALAGGKLDPDAYLDRYLNRTVRGVYLGMIHDWREQAAKLRAQADSLSQMADSYEEKLKGQKDSRK